MKAEQRKELETNTLADKVGQAMQRVKGSSRRSLVIYLVVGVVLVVGLWLGYREWTLRKQETSLHWLMLDDGSDTYLKQLATLNTPAGRSARLQIAWLIYWEQGVRMIGVNPPGAMKAISVASSTYADIAKECKEANDTIFEPQALLGIAVCTETLAAQDITSLGRAKEAYAKIVDHEKYKDSAEGKFAQKRLDHLNDKTKFKEMELVYEELQKTLQIPGVQKDFLQHDMFNPKGKGKEKDN
jgi:hypothetical protein